MRKTFLIGIAALLVLLTGCAQEPAEDKKDAIKIGGVFALTGVGASIGMEELNGAQLAVNDINAAGGINGRQIEFIVTDISLDKMTETAAAARKLLDIDNVVGIVGPTWDEPADLLLPLTEEAQVPVIGPDQTDNVEVTRDFTYNFSTWHDNRVGIRELLRFAKEKEWGRVAIIRPVPAGFWEFTRDLFIEYAPEYDVEIVEDININDLFGTDYRTHLTKAMQSKPDAIFMVLTENMQCSFMKQKKELGTEVPMLGTESSGNLTALTACPELLEDMYFSTPRMPESATDVALRYEETFGHPPQFPSVWTSYDAMGVLAQAIDETDSTDGEILREYLKKLNDYKGVSLDSITFNEKGFVITPEDAFEMQTVRNGEFVEYIKE